MLNKNYYNEETDQIDCYKFYNYYLKKLNSTEITKMSKEEILKFLIVFELCKNKQFISLKNKNKILEKFSQEIKIFTEDEIKKIDLLNL